MRSLSFYVAVALILAFTGAAAGAGEVTKAQIVTQPVCTTGTCPTTAVPTTYVHRQKVYVPTTIETVYEVKSQTVIQDEPVVATGTCRPAARVRLPRLRLFRGACCN